MPFSELNQLKFIRVKKLMQENEKPSQLFFYHLRIQLFKQKLKLYLCFHSHGLCLECKKYTDNNNRLSTVVNLIMHYNVCTWHVFEFAFGCYEMHSGFLWAISRKCIKIFACNIDWNWPFKHWSQADQLHNKILLALKRSLMQWII